jgi:hypothetical protein
MSRSSRALMVDCPSCGTTAGVKCKGQTYCPERWERAERLGRMAEKWPDLRKPMDPEIRRKMKRMRE